ncbi:MAG: hypothetical protein R2708_08560 [Vicinamibacterales bacterium]
MAMRARRSARLNRTTVQAAASTAVDPIRHASTDHGYSGITRPSTTSGDTTSLT